MKKEKCFPKMSDEEIKASIDKIDFWNEFGVASDWARDQLNDVRKKAGIDPVSQLDFFKTMQEVEKGITDE